MVIRGVGRYIYNWLKLDFSCRRIATEKLTVRCGEWDTTRTEEPLEHQDRQVVIKTSHPLFNNKSLAEDFATLHVDREFVLSAHIGRTLIELGFVWNLIWWEWEVFFSSLPTN